MLWETKQAKVLTTKEVSSSTIFPNPINLFGHNGWVWSLANCPEKNELCSTSFDCTVKLWDVDHCYQNGKDKTIRDSVSTVKVNSPSLCSNYIDSNTIAIGLNNKNVVTIDSRSKYSII